MPELPEVETVRAGLATVLRGRRITEVDVLCPRTLRRQEGGAREFAARVRGRTIREVARRGKFLWCVLDDDGSLLAHLGMSCQFRWRSGRAGAGADADARVSVPHARAELRLTAGWEEGCLTFADQRTFGYLMAAALEPTADALPGGQGTTRALVPAPVAHIARDLFDPALDFPALAAALAQSKRAIKTVLLDQSLVSGIGNIYADEALWRAGVNGEQRAAGLGPSECARVLQEAMAVMRLALAAGGTSFDALYVNVNGRSGYFARHLDVYGREGEPCGRCGTPISRVAYAGRSSHYCPRCQPRPLGLAKAGRTGS